KTVHSNRHRSHNGQTELANGKILPGNDSPERAERILAALEHHAIGPVIEPQRHDLASIQRIHPAGYLSFLQGVWPRWRDEGHTGPAMASVWHTDNFPRERNSTSIVAALGQHSFDGAASIVEGTFDAAAASIDVALTSADLLINGDRAAFALCRPPGHHAGAAYMGGYCYLNNAAAAAQRFLENARASRISILDVDYHHGNGTQDIFY
ncbi:histone deacetylase family protein, partial [Salmonella enterica subsp. enterica serovar Enteritidis]|nr:histone deacetylase family protein [Salmonella enterica subsp. enterica serovar Enteritidis]